MARSVPKIGILLLHGELTIVLVCQGGADGPGAASKPQTSRLDGCYGRSADAGRGLQAPGIIAETFELATFCSVATVTSAWRKASWAPTSGVWSSRSLEGEAFDSRVEDIPLVWVNRALAAVPDRTGKASNVSQAAVARRLFATSRLHRHRPTTHCYCCYCHHRHHWNRPNPAPGHRH